jgi:hypothetical protein
MAARVQAGSPASAHSSSPVGALQLARVVRGAASPMSTGAVVVQVGSARVEVEAGTDRATLALVFEALNLASGAVR